jgi:hypothetical protein
VPKLPRLPATPKRPLPAPAREESAQIEVRRVDFSDAEPPTKPTTESLALYQSLLSVFDGLTQEERGEFVELAALWASMNRQERRVLMGLLARR